MGEAAEWEIFRRHGVDISDDGHLDRHFNGPRRKARSKKQVSDGWQHKDDIPEPPGGWAYGLDNSLRDDLGGRQTPAQFERHRRRLLKEHDNRLRRELLSLELGDAVRVTVVKPKLNTNPPEHINCRSTYKEQGNMDYKEAITLLQLTQGATLFRARYIGGQNNQQEYTFKNCIGVHLAEDDLVIVQSRDSLALVTVSSVNLTPSQIGCPLAQLKHLVAKVDRSQVDAILEREQKAAHELALSELHGRLDTLRSQMPAGAFQAAQQLLAAPPASAPMWGDRVPQPSWSNIQEDVIDHGDTAAAPEAAFQRHNPLKTPDPRPMTHEERQAERRRAERQADLSTPVAPATEAYEQAAPKVTG